jgi:hypothetical protein
MHLHTQESLVNQDVLRLLHVNRQVQYREDQQLKLMVKTA